MTLHKFLYIMERKAHRTLLPQHNRELEQLESFSEQDIHDMAQKALEAIPERVKFYAEKLGVTYGRITIRNQRTKWGSCTSKGNLNFNCLLMAAPPEVLDSVVVHELCHRLHMNHSKEFYTAIYSVFPDYDRWNKWLKDNGSLLIRRMTVGAREQEAYMEQYIVDAFTDKTFSGNPAAVCVLDSFPSEDIMQCIAAENNLSETAFVVKENYRYHIRWFTPKKEIDFCGHATLATAFSLTLRDVYS